MVVWDKNAIIKNLAEICGDDAVTHCRTEENDDEMGFFDFLGGENDAEAEEEEDDEEKEEQGLFRNSTNRVNFGVKVSELVNVSELSGGEQKVSGPKIRKFGQGHFQG